MGNYVTEQEAFWASSFGDAYTEKYNTADLLSSRLGLWTEIVRKGGPIDSCLELGAGAGLNFRVLGMLFPKLQMTGVEINRKAAEECAKIPRVTVVRSSIHTYHSEARFDLTFTAGTLILLAPERLPEVYDTLYYHSKKYIALAEYYNPTPLEVVYHGKSGRLCKRDFAGEIMDRFPDVHLVDYGFVYHRDAHFPADDVNWFLLEKRA